MDAVVSQLFKRYGVLALVVLWLNFRLTTVEDKLYDCWANNKTSMESGDIGTGKKQILSNTMFAILPDRRTYAFRRNEKL